MSAQMSVNNRAAREGVSRRQLLGRAGGAAAGSLAAASLLGAATAAPARAAAAAAATASVGPEPQVAGFGGPVTIKPGDVRYDSMLRGDNFRFAGSPDEVVVVSSTSDVVHAVSAAVRAGKRIAPRSGGHCFENFTTDPGIRVLLDLSPMDAVTFDPVMGAFSVQPGARLGQIYTTLFKGW